MSDSDCSLNHLSQDMLMGSERKNIVNNSRMGAAKTTLINDVRSRLMQSLSKKWHSFQRVINHCTVALRAQVAVWLATQMQNHGGTREDFL